MTNDRKGALSSEDGFNALADRLVNYNVLVLNLISV
jgi:hypothetical protein